MGGVAKTRRDRPLPTTRSGQRKCELVFGADKAPKEHHEVTKKNPAMEYDDPNRVTLWPGKSSHAM